MSELETVQTGFGEYRNKNVFIRGSVHTYFGILSEEFSETVFITRAFSSTRGYAFEDSVVKAIINNDPPRAEYSYVINKNHIHDISLVRDRT